MGTLVQVKRQYLVKRITREHDPSGSAPSRARQRRGCPLSLEYRLILPERRPD